MPIKRKISTDFAQDTDESSEINTKSKSNIIVKVLFVLLVLSLIGLVASLLSHRNMSKKLSKLSNSPQQQEAIKKEINELVKKVGNLIVLPPEETPTVATINDAEGLSKSQSFYAGSSNGDKVLIYFEAQKAYIYNPNTNKLINVGPVYVNNTTTTALDTTTQPIVNKLSIEIRNGSGKTGAASKVSDNLKSNASFNVVSVGDASTSTYKSNLLVDNTSGDKSELVKSLEKTLGLTAVTTLPAGEKSTTADVMLIVAE